MSSPRPNATGSRLLAALPPDSLERLLPKLTPMVLEQHQPIFAADGPIDQVLFPTAGMVSMVTTLEEGVQAEVGIIGNEGCVGIPLLLGVRTSFVETMVQVAGAALRMSTRDFQAEQETNAPFRAMLMRYNEALQAQIMQTAACNGRHGLEQRLARWLLMAHDRIEGDEIALTQEFIAMMLGVHRPSLTVAAGILQRAGLIRYGGGRITVLNRANLEAASCECHAAVRRRYAALLGSDLA